MRKNFLFATLAVLLAGFWFGGASLADCEAPNIACIGNVWYASLAEAVSNASSGDIITLLSNDNVSFSWAADTLKITIDRALTIDGKGFTVFWSGDYAYDNNNPHELFISSTAWNVTIKNLTLSWFWVNSEVSRGRIVPIYASYSYAGDLTLDGVNFNDFNDRALVLGNWTATIKNCSFNGNKTPTDAYYQQAIQVSNAQVTLEWLTINNMWSNMKDSNEEDYAAWAIQLGDAQTATNWEITIKDGNYNWDFALIITTGASNNVIINGGNFVWKILLDSGTNSTFQISAWKFSVQPDASYIVAWKIVKEISDGDYKYEVTNPDPAPSYSWGGGSGGSKSSTKTDTKATTGDNKTVDNNKTDETKADETKTNENNWNNDGKAPATDSKYSQEMIDAYNWAFKNWITTMPNIDEADMEGGLTRIAMAKMLSQYAINILGKTPDTSKVVPAFPDVTAQMDADYGNGVTLAYQLGIMWIGINEFRPNDLVTRAEFATALSRLLFNTPDGEDNYYTTHLQKLMDEKIITVDTPDLQELRGYVMIMLMRSANS